MAEDKKSIIVYADWIEKFEELTDDEAGKLIKHFFRYVNDQNPEAPDRTTKLMFIDIKNTLKRDLTKYEQKKDERSQSGRIGNLKRWNKDLYDRFKQDKLTLEAAESLAESRKVSHSDKIIAKVAVSDSDSVSDSDTLLISDSDSLATLYYSNESDFLKDWNHARISFEGKQSNIAKLATHERIEFNLLIKEFTIEQFKNGIRGLFSQKDMYAANKLRPTHFLKDRNIEKFIDCNVNKSQLFNDKSKNDRL